MQFTCNQTKELVTTTDKIRFKFIKKRFGERIEDQYGSGAARLAASSANEIEHSLGGLSEIGVMRGDLRMLLSLLHRLQQLTKIERYSSHGYDQSHDFFVFWSAISRTRFQKLRPLLGE